MTSPSASPTKAMACKVPSSQRGAFSPFLFGLIVGMSVFSALSMKWAQAALVKYQTEQAERAQANAEEVAKGMHFAILTENKQTYSENYDLDRARAYSSSTGKTMGKQDYMVEARRDTGSNGESFGAQRSTVAIAGTDDTLLRSKIYRSGDAEQLLRAKTDKTSDVAIYDTSMARDQQIRTSATRMSTLAEQLYAFYSSHSRFPTVDEELVLANTFGVRDVWGQQFDYEVDKEQQNGILSFTTPWNYTHTLNLNLKDDGQ